MERTVNPEEHQATAAPVSECVPGLSVEWLKTISGTTVVDGYIVKPHFLAQVFGLAQKNPRVRSYLAEVGFYTSTSHRMNSVKSEVFFNLLTVNEKRELVTGRNSQDYQKYLSYLESDKVKSSNRTGICLNFVRQLNAGESSFQRSDEDKQAEGDWKLHVSVSMGSQEDIEDAYGIILQAIKRSNIHSIKIAVPFVEAKSMPGKEITIYLKYESPENAQRIENFIISLDSKLSRVPITPGIIDELVNKRISGSSYISYRNESARVKKVDQITDVPSTGQRAIVLCDRVAYFAKNSKWVVDGDENKITNTGSEFVYLEDGAYFSANLAKITASIFSDISAYNVFRYDDERFCLGAIEIIKAPGSRKKIVVDSDEENPNLEPQLDQKNDGSAPRLK